ncbi:hypothetical protein AABB02_37005 [Streptomyces rimosus]|uniref:hypothetical protein n=1 Tax=Streptomyces rimosus TaxID=1927 RepID=UPI0031DABAFF
MLDHEVAVHAGHRARRARTAPADGWADGTLLAELHKLEPGAPGPVQLALMRAGTARVHARGEIMIMTGGADTFVLLLLDGFAKRLSVWCRVMQLILPSRSPAGPHAPGPHPLGVHSPPGRRSARHR